MLTTAVRLTGEKMAIFVAPVRRVRWERAAIEYNDANRRLPAPRSGGFVNLLPRRWQRPERSS